MFASSRRQLVKAPFLGCRRQSQCAPAAQIDAIDTNQNPKLLRVSWRDGAVGHYPYVWLRDFANSKRSTILHELALSVRPDKLSVAKGGTSLLVEWPAYVKSEYSAQWLRRHLAVFKQLAGGGGANISAGEWSSPSVAFGRPAERAELPTFQPTELQLSSTKLSETLLRHGAVRLAGLGSIEDAARFVLNAGMAERRTATLASDASRAQALRTGQPHQSPVPRLLMLGLSLSSSAAKKRSTGGAIQLSDGFAVADELRRQQPADFGLLSSVAIQYAGELFSSEHRPLRVDAEGRVTQVVFNNERRSTMLPVQFERFYRALKVFNSVCYRRAIDVQLKNDEFLLIDNGRLLHGNSAFPKNTTGVIQEQFFD